jgi:hypothetical protein
MSVQNGLDGGGDRQEPAVATGRAIELDTER